MQGDGNACRMRCPYHAWTYDLGGRLIGLPRADELPHHARADLGLLPVRVETLGPLVFAHLEQDAEPLANVYPTAMAELARTGVDLARLVPVRTQHWRLTGNWKNALENYLECYHCAVAHPEAAAVIDVGRDAYALFAAGYESRQTSGVGKGPGTRRDDAAARHAGPAGDDAVPTPGRIDQFHFLYPNLTINSRAGVSNLSIDVWQPDEASHTAGCSTHFFDPPADPAFVEEVIALDGLVSGQDAGLVASVQKALAGGRPRKTCLLPDSERLVIHFQGLIVDSLAVAT